jgi:uncharacterized membrane protein
MPEPAAGPVHPSHKKIVLVYGLTAAGTLAWLAGIFLAPYLRGQGSRWAWLVQAVYSPVCHQLPSRSFQAWGFPLGVCARCLGIYLGFGAGLALYPAARGFHCVRLPATKTFLAFSAPIVIDTAATFLGIWDSSGPTRLALGFLWGSLLPFFLITGFAELTFRRQPRQCP